MNIGLYFLGFVLNVDGLERNINEHVGEVGLQMHIRVYILRFFILIDT